MNVMNFNHITSGAFSENNELVLRPLRMEDAGNMYEFTSNPEVTEYMTWSVHTTIEQDEAFIKRAMKDKESIYMGIEIKEEKKLIGNIHLYEISQQHKRAEISYILNPRYSGKGYATEAVRLAIQWAFENGFQRIQALCIEGHKKSENLMKRCDMKFEGILRNYAVLKGESYNMRLYAACKEDLLS